MKIKFRKYKLINNRLDNLILLETCHNVTKNLPTSLSDPGVARI
jgi:hypothetical protein